MVFINAREKSFFRMNLMFNVAFCSTYSIKNGITGEYQGE